MVQEAIALRDGEQMRVPARELVPGDVVGQMMGQAGSAAAEQALREFFGLDRPIWQQYLVWLGQVLNGDFGDSWTRGLPVTEMVGDAFLVTLQIGVMTLALAALVGIPLGLIAGLYEGRLVDTLIQLFNVLGLSAFHQEYVRTAIAKGVPLRVVFFKHILRNIMIPIITFMGLIFIQILGGVVIIESLFSLPGLGRLLLTAIETRDYPVLQGALLMVVLVALIVNLAVDLTYRLIDPRVRVA